ncbi:MAG TPA: 5-(carboxyamino)imidazole ribonucleotide mutase [Gammaproteobacteria bacterium]|jgi:5-(carboxyamino)imidazole ribonucleotide mutase|nr:5-(carboxyamino)imidazole ribonucleotide mutase [Gammaproteobacteria bacterium]HIK72489.1 5-(carboxyamino)imidazole ribonucleotide mutase [Gammaproteobacteria bacterium]
MSFNLEKDVSTTVSIIIGSESDLELANKCSDTLESLSITNSTQVLSAHRTPDLLENHVRECEEGGTKVFVAIAGLAAHLAGAVASKTILPVIGVPGDGGPLRGMDALLSTVQMPKGIPVATVAIGSSGAVNSAYLAAQILGIESKEIRNSLLQVREDGKEAIKKSNQKLLKS